MRTLIAFLFCVIFGYQVNVYGQDAEWEPQTQITGYLSTQAEYIKDLKFSDREYGVNLSEAGVLMNYSPTQQLSIKAVFVYKPYYEFDQMLNELCAEYQLGHTSGSMIKFKAGRFLVPLSPINTNFYAPVNVGITLPLIISHHELFPLNMDGLSLNGKLGETVSFNYNLFGGGYRNSVLLASGPLNFFGNEDTYLMKISGGVSQFNLDEINTKLSFGGGLHLGLSHLEFGDIGVNYFTHAKGSVSVPIPISPTVVVTDTAYLQRKTFGVNFNLNYKGFRVTGEHWWCTVTVSDILGVGTLESDDNKGIYYSLDYSAGKFIPYVKYEYHGFDLINLDYSRYTAGINFKPRFETTFKLEYVHYDYDQSLNGFLAAIIYSF